MPPILRTGLAALALSALPLVAPLAARAAAQTTDCKIPANIAKFRADLLAGMNAMRHEKGLAPLTMAPKLQEIAQKQACDDAVKGIYSHTGLDGSSYEQRFKRVGYPAQYARENTGMGAPAEGNDNIDAILGLWKISPYHRGNILDPHVTQAGIGKAHGDNGNDFWVVDFGKR